MAFRSIDFYLSISILPKSHFRINLNFFPCAKISPCHRELSSWVRRSSPCPACAGWRRITRLPAWSPSPTGLPGAADELTPPPVKQLALQLGIPVIQPQRLKEPEAMQQLQEWAPEVIVVAAFGQILRPAVLDLPPFGCVNVHASLLPRWRGAAPIQAAILHGDPHTGITIMRMDPGVDTGAILSQQSIADPARRHRRQPGGAPGRAGRRAPARDPARLSEW